MHTCVVCISDGTSNRSPVGQGKPSLQVGVMLLEDVCESWDTLCGKVPQRGWKRFLAFRSLLRGDRQEGAKLPSSKPHKSVPAWGGMVPSVPHSSSPPGDQAVPHLMQVKTPCRLAVLWCSGQGPD